MVKPLPVLVKMEQLNFGLYLMGNANLRYANILIAYMELLSALMGDYSPMVVTTAQLGFGARLMAIACKS
jgi:hypothetical protein